MKKISSFLAFSLLVVSPFSFAEEFMNQEQRQAAFCGKTFDGENLITGTTFKIHIDQDCKTNTIHYLTGKIAGKTFERKITSISPNGELCRTSNDGKKEDCNKMQDMGDGTFEATGISGRWKGKRYVRLSNFVDGNQL
jgi:hypothetical protein